ncbi:NAD(P)/FAD-dependent oxidoreductase [soil metagenome]
MLSVRAGDAYMQGMTFTSDDGSILDCAVIGGGPAGLTAAVYLGRARRLFCVFDGGESRARWIPTSHNTPGFPQGVGGEALLSRLREQAEHFGTVIRTNSVTGLSRSDDEVFTLETDAGAVRARTVILATGVRDREPHLPDMADAVKRGLIRICPICDGYESSGLNIGVIGSGEHAAAEALFLHTYSERVTVLRADERGPSDGDSKKLVDANVPVIACPVTSVSSNDGRVTCLAAEGHGHPFDVVYAALGVEPGTALARACGAELSKDDRLVVDEHMQTSVKGLYGAGDVVRGLNQIAVAYSEAAVAATAIHNSLPRNPV